MNKQNGFSAVILLLVLLLLVAVGFTGYYVWNTQNNKNKDVAEVAPATTTKQETNQETPPAAETVYKSTCLKYEPLCLKYPESWQAQLTSSDSPNNASNYPNDNLKITSSKGSVFEIQTGIDGIGGGCDDTSYTDSSRIKVLSSEKSTIANNLFVAKVKFGQDYAYANGGEEKIWLISQSPLTPTVNPNDLLHCTAAFNAYKTLESLKYTIKIEASNISSDDEIELFKMFQSIKIN
jgi:hypothetical protein